MVEIPWKHNVYLHKTNVMGNWTEGETDGFLFYDPFFFFSVERFRSLHLWYMADIMDLMTFIKVRLLVIKKRKYIKKTTVIAGLLFGS